MKNFKEITSVSAAFKALGWDESARPDFSKVPDESLKKALSDHFDLIVVFKAVNAGWEPDWDNIDQRKWFLWARVENNESSPSGFGFSAGYCLYSYTYANVGSRLCTETEEQLAFIYDNFKHLFEGYLLIAK